MTLDLERYNQVTGLEALKKLLDGELVYFMYRGKIHFYEIRNSDLYCSNTPSGKSTVQVAMFLNKHDTNWYVEKKVLSRQELQKSIDEFNDFVDAVIYLRSEGDLS